MMKRYVFFSLLIAVSFCAAVLRNTGLKTNIWQGTPSIPHRTAMPLRSILMREPWNGGEERFAVVNLVRNGMAVRYDSMGRRRLEFCYTDNVETGPFTAYDTEGRVTCSGNLVNGRYDGKIIFHHSDGTIRAVDSYRLGQRDGICEEYGPEGQSG